MDWDILGHEWAVEHLQAKLERGTPGQAYLFTGPEGVGRRTLAIRFAQALNCPQPRQPGIPCRECPTCRQFENMVHPDLHIVQADQAGGVLRVDQIRALQHGLSLAPYQGSFRIALLLRFEEANDSAANALLKTLEEPPPRVILILTADNPESLLPTIVSRCEVLRLRPLPVSLVREGLETRWGVPAGEAELLANLSGGRPGYALRLRRDGDQLLRRQAWLDDHRRLLASIRVDRFAFAEKQAKDKETLRELLTTWHSLWRDVMLRISAASQPVLNPDRSPEIQFLAENLDLETVLRITQRCECTIDLIDRNINPRLAFEVLLLDLPKLGIERAVAPRTK
jgi:DNA polymerase-3 subunit delta'